MSIRSRALVTVVLAILLPVAAVATPLGRSFTYQGQLSQSGTPVDGTVHLRFSLWDAAGSGIPPAGGTQIGSSEIIPNVSVDDGLFTTEVNAGDVFGASAFGGEARWLQVEVCTDGTCTSSTVLGPRQALTAAPYALGPWYINGTGLSYSGGNVGIGTTTPALALHIKRNQPAIILEDTAIASQQSGYLSFRNSTSETGWIGYGSAGSPHATWANARSGGDIVLWATGEKLRVLSTGNVGVGTSTPASRLEVRGDIRLGSVGEYFSPSSGENLRIIRGKVSSAGSISFGSGFTVSRTAVGVYSITYSTPYPVGAWPVITASAESNGSVARFAMINTPTHISSTIRIVNGSGTAADADFYFIVVGTR